MTPSKRVLVGIHGNPPALSAVLAEADVAAADAVVLLGDIAPGPMPAKTLDRTLAGLGERAVWLPLTVTLDIEGTGAVLPSCSTPSRPPLLVAVPTPYYQRQVACPAPLET
jgi:hypothetical protein